MTTSRWRGLAGAAVALIVVGMIGLLLAHNLGGRGGHSPIDASATASASTAGASTPTLYPSGKTIIPDPTYPVIAPSNPQIAYEVQGDTIARSTDGGRTYTAGQPLPTTLTNATAVVSVSPLDANHLIATANGTGNTSSLNCHTPRGQAASVTGPRQQRPLANALSGFGPCSESFFSGDGGQTWNKLNLPYQDVIGALLEKLTVGSSLYAPSYTLMAQANRLYALIGQANLNGMLVTGINPHPVELVMSMDDGATWQVASNGLGGTLCDVAPAPTGETVYAVVAASDCGAGETLWRSDDAGAHWAQINTLPALFDAGMEVSPNGALAITLATLHTGTPQGTGANPLPDALIVSVDGGATFTHAPAAPTTEAPIGPQFAGPLAVLHDGSFLVLTETLASQGDHSTFYAWRIGASAWRQVGIPLSGTIVEVVVTPHTGSDTLYLINGAGQMAQFTVS